mmetsp:Transcript_89301/g.248000  ORF Transcript_89301/g.248000 Transcript_89301/m.248000 type:complete len:161 (-) Transcript_89301:27-509(-)
MVVKVVVVVGVVVAVVVVKVVVAVVVVVALVVVPVVVVAVVVVAVAVVVVAVEVDVVLVVAVAVIVGHLGTHTLLRQMSSLSSPQHHGAVPKEPRHPQDVVHQPPVHLHPVLLEASASTTDGIPHSDCASSERSRNNGIRMDMVPIKREFTQSAMTGDAR